MKKITALALACVMLFSVAFALPVNASIMPRTGFFDEEVKLSAGSSWTSSKYNIPGEYDYIYLDVDWISGGDVTVELYGSNALSTAGIKVGTISTAGTNNLSVRHNYSYYHFKVINNSKSASTSIVMLYA